MEIKNLPTPKIEVTNYKDATTGKDAARANVVIGEYLLSVVSDGSGRCEVFIFGAEGSGNSNRRKQLFETMEDGGIGDVDEIADTYMRRLVGGATPEDLVKAGEEQTEAFLNTLDPDENRE